jgi:hypothetical protein
MLGLTPLTIATADSQFLGTGKEERRWRLHLVKAERYQKRPSLFLDEMLSTPPNPIARRSVIKST